MTRAPAGTPPAPVDEVPVDHRRARVYAEGWQSWSPATWYAVDGRAHLPQEEWQHLMRFRPGTPLDPRAPQAEGLLVVDPGDGAPVRRYATGDPLRVPTLRAEHVGGTVRVLADGDVETTTHPDAVAALESYGDRLGRAPLTAPLAAPPRVWCSWYRYFEEVTADDVAHDVASLDRLGLEVEVVQIDDGWSLGLGHLLAPSDRFGSLPRLVDRIRSGGRRAGAWLAPFLVGADTPLAREHPDWLVGPAGRNWGQELRGLDLTHPGVRALLVAGLEDLLRIGVDYLKLDFLYAGALPGRRHAPVDAVAAYRSGLELVREVVGPDVYLVGCGAPLLPSLGLVDAMRVSPDTFHLGGEDGSTRLRGLMPLAARAWQQGRWWVNDPDCVVARPAYRHRDRWAAAARELGGLRSFSDRLDELDATGLATVRDLLADGGSAAPLAAETVRRGAALAAQEGAAASGAVDLPPEGDR